MSKFQSLVREVLELNSYAAAVEVHDVWFTWGDIKSRIDALDALYDNLGLRDDARVGLLIRNRFDQYCALFSVLGTGRCLVTLNPLYPPSVLANDIRFSAPAVIVGERVDLEAEEISSAISEVGCAVVELSCEGIGRPVIRRRGDKGRGDSDSLTRPGIIIEMLTSGTTGQPKRVPLRRTSFEHAFERGMSLEGGRTPDDPPRLRNSVQLLTSPLVHIGGIWHAVFQLTAGRKACLLEKFELRSWLAAVVRHRPKVGTLPPAALRMVLDANVAPEDLESLVVIGSGTAPLDWALVDEMWERYRIPVLTNYGATEFAGAVAGWNLSDFKKYRKLKRGSVGRLLGSADARVVDPESGTPLSPGAEGVLEMRGPQIATAEGEWLRTTDRARLDRDDFLWITGRADNVIVRGGFKVHPDVVVDALNLHPAVREAVVVGVKDARLGEAPHAAILLKQGAAQPSDAELITFLRGQLLPYQVPVRFHFLEDFPRTASLKPALQQLREILLVS